MLLACRSDRNFACNEFSQKTTACIRTVTEHANEKQRGMPGEKVKFRRRDSALALTSCDGGVLLRTVSEERQTGGARLHWTLQLWQLGLRAVLRTEDWRRWWRRWWTIEKMAMHSSEPGKTPTPSSDAQPTTRTVRTEAVHCRSKHRGQTISDKT